MAAEDASDGDDEADAEIQDSLPRSRRSARIAVRDLREAVSAMVSHGQAGRTKVVGRKAGASSGAGG
jgi:hypothetical protein